MNRVRERRAALGLSLSELARATGYGKSYLSEIERGIKTPSLVTAATIATTLGVSIEDLFPELFVASGRLNCQ